MIVYSAWIVNCDEGFLQSSM